MAIPVRVTPNDDAYHYGATTLSVFWPRAEHEKLLARWPHLAADVGATWDEHRRQHERHCELVTRAGHGVNQTPGNLADLETFLRDRKVRKPSTEDLLAYPDLRTQPAMTPGHRHGPQPAGAARDASTTMLPPARPGHSRLTGSA